MKQAFEQKTGIEQIFADQDIGEMVFVSRLEIEFAVQQFEFIKDFFLAEKTWSLRVTFPGVNPIKVIFCSYKNIFAATVNFRSLAKIYL